MTTEMIMPIKSNGFKAPTQTNVIVQALAVLSLLVWVTADPSTRHPNQRELRYVIQEELLIGSHICDIADDAGLVDRYGTTVARSALRFRFLATPRVPVEVDEVTGKIRTSGRLDREEICGEGGDEMELCLDRLDVVVQPMNYFQIIKVIIVKCYTHVINIRNVCFLFQVLHTSSQFHQSSIELAIELVFVWLRYNADLLISAIECRIFLSSE